MTSSEALRFAIVVVAMGDIGLMAALFVRVGRYFIPHLEMRLGMSGVACLLAGVISGNAIRYHAPATWPLWLVLAGAVLILFALIRVFHWYGSLDGRRHFARMQASLNDTSPHEPD